MPTRGGTPLNLLHAAAKSAADRSGPVTPSSPGTAVNASRANAAIGSRFARVIISLNGAMYAPQAAFFSELFGTRVRYTGASLGSQLASVIAGGFSPIIEK